MPPTDILVFGEDHNDCSAISHLVKAILPAGKKPKVTTMRRPIILARDAAGKKRAKMSEEVAQFARGYEKAGKRVTVVAHRDCDALEPAHVSHSAALEADLKAAGVSSPVAACPAWEIEAWWMLFPRAISEVRPAWRKVDYGSQNVGKIQNAKERLTRDLRPPGKPNCRDFHESDGARIAEHVAKNLSHLERTKAQSESFTAFKAKLLAAMADDKTTSGVTAHLRPSAKSP